MTIQVTATGAVMNSENPYAPTAASMESPAIPSQDDAVRRQYLSHEASLKSVGTLYLIGGVILVLSFIGLMAGLIFASRDQETAALGQTIGISLGIIALGALQLWIAFGLRKLNPQVRIPVIILSYIGLIGFPIGTIISAYVLYLAASKKGKFVFSDEYKRVIAATPHIKYKTSIIVWVFLGIVLLLLIAGAISAYNSRL